jgi:voltage-gated potassium channel
MASDVQMADARQDDVEEADVQHESSMYELFMGLMTILSLIVMAWILLARVPQVDDILIATDTLFCVMFLFDFGRSLIRADDKRTYLFGERPGRSLPHGVLDLLGSIPSVGIFRIFRVFRLARVNRILQARGARALAGEFVRRRAESAIYIIFITALLVLVCGSIAISIIEPDAEGSNIKTASDAFWWAFVTITTVGYGDRYPVTNAGRLIGMITMAVGIGIFGVLTSYLSTLFLAPRTSDGEEPLQDETATADQAAPTADQSAADTVVTSATTPDAVAAELASLRGELADLRRLLEPERGPSA